MYISRLSVHGYKNTCQKSVISLNKGLNILLGETAVEKLLSLMPSDFCFGNRKQIMVVLRTISTVPWIEQIEQI